MVREVEAQRADREQAYAPSSVALVPAPVEFRPFVTDDIAEAIRLLSIGKPEDYAPRKREVFEWQFLRNPHADGRAPFLVGTSEGRIVALNGFMPARVQFHGARVAACWSCDTFVSSELRGRGIGKKLIDQVTRAAGLMLGYGISDMSDPIFNKFQWLLHPDVELVFRHVSERGVVGALKNAASRVASLRGLRVHGAEHETWDSLGDDAQRELDELWARNAAGYCNAITRDGAYLRWKYFEHPLHRYRAYAMREGSTLTAVLFARHDATESVIVDYSGPATAEDKIASLALAIVDGASKAGAARIKCESTHKPLVAALKRVGFIPSSHQGSRFRVRVNTESGDALRGWLLMPGDSDGDVLMNASTIDAQAGATRTEVGQ